MRQIAIIGLGNLGYYLGRELSRMGHDVIGLDVQRDLVQRVKNDVNQAVIADGTDKETLRSLGLDRTDLAVVTIGTNMLASIITTFNLKELGVREIHAKALSEDHARILSQVGADRILFPERDLAMSLALRLHNPNMLEYLPTTHDYGIVEIGVPEKFVGKTLRELDLINRFGVQVLAIHDKPADHFTFIPRADFILRADHVLIMMAPSDAIEKLPKDSG